MIICAVLPDVVSHIEQLDTPILLTNGAGQLVSASRTILASGVERGMRQRFAHSLCPDAMIVPFQELKYREFAEGIEAELLSLTTYVEVVAPFWRKHAERQFFLPLSSGAWYINIGKVLPREGICIAQELGETLKRKFHAEFRFGLSAGKFPSQLATGKATVLSPYLISRGQEGGFVAPYPLSFLPLSKDAKEQLHLLGIRTIGDVARLSVAALSVLDGKRGQLVYQIAQGQDPRHVSSYVVRPHHQIRRVFETPIEDGLQLDVLFLELGQSLGEFLKGQSLIVQTIELILTLERGKRITAKRTLREATSHVALLGRTLMRLKETLSLEEGIIEVAVIAHELQPIQMRQLDLFGEVGKDTYKLAELLETLGERLDEESLYQVEKQSPDDFALERRFMLTQVQVA